MGKAFILIYLDVGCNVLKNYIIVFLHLHCVVLKILIPASGKIEIILILRM